MVPAAGAAQVSQHCRGIVVDISLDPEIQNSGF